MSDHMTKPLADLASDIVADGIVDAEEVKKIRERIYADGIIDREEADFLFTINDAVSGGNNDPSWKEIFVEAISDHVLKDEISPDVVDEDESQYLISKIQADKKVDDVELATIVHIIATAKSTPESFQKFVLSSLKEAVLEDGIIDETEVQTICKVIYGTGSGAGEGVDRAEADFMFELNDAVTGKDNHPSWQTLFVEAISKHVLEDEVSPGEVDEDEANWLISRIEGDEQVDDTEKALLKAIKEKAKSIANTLKFKMDLWKI
ncbi:MAG: hypothetical protein ACFFDN_03005 [Candidatus Hodarchaeota archaeon]